MPNQHEHLVDILAVLFPDSRDVPRERRIQRAREIFNTEQSASAALSVATKHVDDLTRLLRERPSSSSAVFRPS